MDEKTRIFEDHRRLLVGIAYRMLGTLADAQDVVQDTFVKWNDADFTKIGNPRSWLVTVCTRLALDQMKSARARREAYVGAWLPEPFLDQQSADPARRMEIDESVSLALMLALEKLSPAERAALLLHEVFGYDFEEIATILDKSAAACRKLASRARVAVQAERPRFHATPQEHQRLLDAFLKAAHSGDLNGLRTVLTDGVELHADGGGKVLTAPDVLRGADEVSRFFVRVMYEQKTHREATRIVPRWFNGVPGVLIYEGGRLVVALSVSIESGKIDRIYALRNPEKLVAFN